MLDRRRFLTGAIATGGAFYASPRLALAAAGTDRRFIFVIQRGAADGLDIVRPVGDPAFAVLRARLIGEKASLPLDGFFALHPSLQGVAQLYGQKQALFVHAVASPYRDRSHFDGQNVLETGGSRPYQVGDGWLNRLAGLLPPAHAEAVALTPTMPLALRGRAPVTSYAPSELPPPGDDLMTRITALYDADRQFHPLWSQAIDAEHLAAGTAGGQDPAGLARQAATFLLQPNGPRIAMIETGGWDTHNAQAGRMAARLAALDTLLLGLRDALGPVWNKTVVLVATEFGRTAAVNGTGGTDHGTGTVAMLVGGAVRGGRVIADWPGLSPARLYEARDLRPTTSLDAVIGGAAGAALGIDPGRVSRSLFQAVPIDRPLTGLVLS